MNTAEIRTRFLDYFARAGHTIVPSSPLVPHGDPTLLFTNAGMVQFKNVFLGKETRPYSRAASCQKCVRAGGKHNDLEQVGRTARHHTFFEMLGNFSFGDYFKDEAIRLAWRFVTEELGIPPARLFITVYEKDDEAARIWLEEIGIDPKRFARIGEEDNFWSMGDTGPCGPCTEIFYDHGPEVPGGPPGTPEADGDRFVEIWNLVFMQYDRDAEGRLHPLPKPSVDTGMGLERIAAVMQGVHSNYDIDLFRHLIAAASDVLGARYGEDAEKDTSLRVIADHLRAVGFLIADGVLPSNEGRGFVLRRILRRAVRHGRLLGARGPFLWRLVAALVDEMGGHYRELVEAQANIEEIVRVEEERFFRTLDRGLKLVEKAARAAEATRARTIPGATLFELYDTYGFPLDLVADILRGRNIRLDEEGFAACMAEQRARARAAWKGSGEEAPPEALLAIREERGPSEFLGYQTLSAEGAVVGILKEGSSAEALNEGEEGWVVLNQTPFYGEAGGQVGDTGVLKGPKGVFVVEDTQRPLADLIVHKGRMQQGTLAVGEVVQAEVDKARREAIRRHHTATHLLHAALREVLGAHVRQAGSLVAPERLRFDFTHPKALTEEELARIERRVNAEIRKNLPVRTHIMSLEEAKAKGAMALFGEKYEDEVRVVEAGFSLELCGGTHVDRTGDIAVFRILREEAVGAGVRRIEAVAGEAAYESFAADARLLAQTARALRTKPEEAPQAAEALAARVRELERALAQAKAKLAASALRELAAGAERIAGVPVLVAKVEDVHDLRDAADKALAQLGEGVVVLGLARDGKAQVVAKVARALTARVQAGAIVRTAAEAMGGRGGGKPEMAMGGAPQPEKLDAALAAARRAIAEALGAA